MIGRGGTRIVPERIRRRSEGFSLLEVLVAFTIFVLVAGAVFQALSGSLRGMRVASEHVHAIALAEAKLAELGVREQLDEGGESGDFENGDYRWRTEIERYRWDGADSESELPVRPYLATVEISWGDGTDRRAVRLQSLQLVAAP